MNATFPMQTGAISYTIDVAVPSASGSWSVSLGYLDIKPNVWSISGVSGKIYDNRGYRVGSYNSTRDTSIEGVINGSGHTLYQDNVLLSNTSSQELSDYNQISIESDYVGGFLPSVSIGGEAVLDQYFNLTVPFWKRAGDGRILFVTENAAADRGFVRAVSGMGFTVDVPASGAGYNTGIYGSQTVLIEDFFQRPYGLIIFGSATSSGLYSMAGWNDLNIPMMSLNSHLVCPENLNWYGGKTFGLTGWGETGAVFPDYWYSAQGVPSIWAEFPTRGWQQLFYSPEYSDPYGTSTPYKNYYVPYASAADPVTSSPTQYIKFDIYGTVWGSTTISVVDDLHSGSANYAGVVDPFEYSDGLQSLGGDKSVTFTDVSGVTGVQTAISTFMGGTGVPSYSLTGTAWGLDQRYNSGRVMPQTASYNVDNLYRRTTLTSGLYPTDQFNMYETGYWNVPNGMSLAHGFGGDTFVSNLDSGKLITVWHKGFWTGGYSGAPNVGNFAKQELISFSVTPTGTVWIDNGPGTDPTPPLLGRDMWETLTVTGKQLFVNAVAGFFID